VHADEERLASGVAVAADARDRLSMLNLAHDDRAGQLAVQVKRVKADEAVGKRT